MNKRGEAAGRWRSLVRRQAASGLSVSAFCRRWGISQASFYVWRRKLRGDAAFVAVCLSPEGGSTADPLELILPRGHRILIRRGFDRATLQALVDALEGGMAVADGPEAGA